jgi:hypothetical protein
LIRFQPNLCWQIPLTPRLFHIILNLRQNSLRFFACSIAILMNLFHGFLSFKSDGAGPGSETSRGLSGQVGLCGYRFILCDNVLSFCA